MRTAKDQLGKWRPLIGEPEVFPHFFIGQNVFLHLTFYRLKLMFAIKIRMCPRIDGQTNLSSTRPIRALTCARQAAQLTEWLTISRNWEWQAWLSLLLLLAYINNKLKSSFIILPLCIDLRALSFWPSDFHDFNFKLWALWLELNTLCFF